MESIAIWLTTTLGLLSILSLSLIIGAAGLFLVIGFDRGLAIGGGYALLFLAVCALFSIDALARQTDAPSSFLASLGQCEREQLVASTAPHLPITIGDVRSAQRRCEKLLKDSPQREADSRTRAQQNAVLSASADSP